MAVDAGETCNPGTPVVGTDLEEAVLVENGVEYPPGIVDAAPVAGHRRNQRLLPALGIVARLGNWGRFPGIGGQIGQESADLGDGIRLVLGEIHDHAVLHLDALVAQVLLGDDLAGRLFYHLGASDEHLAGVAYHHVEVAEAGLHCRQARNGPKHGRDDWY